MDELCKFTHFLSAFLAACYSDMAPTQTVANELILGLIFCVTITLHTAPIF
jgi:Flp pilus assembly protein protease CpaA